METKIIYELNGKDLDKLLTTKLAEIQKESAFNRFTDRMVSVAVVAEIHNIHRDTVIRYANARLIPHARDGKLYKFSLAEVLQFNFGELRRKI